MRARFLLAALLLAGCAAPGRARPDYAELPGPVCARPEVLRMMQERLGGAAQAVFIEPDTAGQIPTARPDTVICAVRVHRQEYDTNRYGTAQLDVVGVRQFVLHLRRNGIFLE